MKLTLPLRLIRTNIAIAAAAATLSFSPLVKDAHASDIPRKQAVVELFTSQGCSSCPPADRLLGELVGNPDVIALTLPVDYWDYLGWKDTLARPAFSERQRGYAEARNDKQVYTPQVVVDGHMTCIGSRKQEVSDRIEKSLKSASVANLDVKISGSSLGISVTPATGAVSAAPMRATVWLVPVRSRVTVDIGHGENGGKTSTYSNVAQDFIKVGEWSGGKADYVATVSKTEDNGADGYVVILQESGSPVPGSILAAAKVGSL